jgi:signal transduction histidine kinase
MLRSLRSRLIASFALIIALSLLGAGSVAVWLLRAEQARSAEERIGRLVDPLSQQVRQLQLLGWPRERVAAEIAGYARYFDVRLLLLDQDARVVLDTDLERPLVGEQLDPPQRTEVAGPAEAYRSARTNLHGQDLYVFSSAVRAGPAPAGWPFQIDELDLLVAVPATDVNAAWARLLPRLLIAAGIAGLGAVAAAVLLARQITRPIAQMTRASEAMARGDYRQQIDVHGRDEVATLGRAFNQMAAQVDRSARSMRQLLADVSHELKTPLTSIQGYSQAMLDGLLEDEAERARAAEVVHLEAERMRSLVDDLLYLSQIESGQLPLARERVNLDAAAVAAEQRFRYQAEAAQVELRLELAGGPVLGDPRRVDQILANLVENAIRHATPGSQVVLRTRRDRRFIACEVRNEGEPIPAEHLPHVFDRFYQVDQARPRNGHSGLGLAIVRELTQAHGGSVSVVSDEHGTTFRVLLPAAPAPARFRPGRAADRDRDREERTAADARLAT